jgi:hypothetical protein
VPVVVVLWKYDSPLGLLGCDFHSAAAAAAVYFVLQSTVLAGRLAAAAASSSNQAGSFTFERNSLSATFCNKAYSS